VCLFVYPDSLCIQSWQLQIIYLQKSALAECAACNRQSQHRLNGYTLLPVFFPQCKHQLAARMAKALCTLPITVLPDADVAEILIKA
jgi:hypothetical protein